MVKGKELEKFLFSLSPEGKIHLVLTLLEKGEKIPKEIIEKIKEIAIKKEMYFEVGRIVEITESKKEAMKWYMKAIEKFKEGKEYVAAAYVIIEPMGLPFELCSDAIRNLELARLYEEAAEIAEKCGLMPKAYENYENAISFYEKHGWYDKAAQLALKLQWISKAIKDFCMANMFDEAEKIAKQYNMEHVFKEEIEKVVENYEKEGLFEDAVEIAEKYKKYGLEEKAKIYKGILDLIKN